MLPGDSNPVQARMNKENYFSFFRCCAKVHQMAIPAKFAYPYFLKFAAVFATFLVAYVPFYYVHLTMLYIAFQHSNRVKHMLFEHEKQNK